MRDETLSVAELIQNGLLSIGDGYRAKNSELSTDGAPFARAGNVKAGFQFDGADCFPLEALGKVGDKLGKPGDVVFTSKGTVGRFAFVQDDTPTFVYSPQLCYWRSLDSSKIHPRFLYYWMHGREFMEQVNGVKGQTDMADYVSLAEQRRMKISLPPLPRQIHVTEVLGSLDDKIQLDRRTNETLEKIAMALYQHWFVDFGPFQNGEFVESEFGMIPQGWSIASLQDVASVNVLSLSRNYPYSTIQYVDISSVEVGRLIATTEYEVLKAPSRAKRLVTHGDVIWSCVRPNRKSYLQIHKPEPNIVVSTGFAVLTPIEVPSSFLYAHTTTDQFVEYLTSNADGSAYPAVRPDTFAAAKVIVPPKSVLESFDEIVAPLYALMHENEAESETLVEIRDSLLPRLMSGEIEAKDAAQTI